MSYKTNSYTKVIPRIFYIFADFQKKTSMTFLKKFIAFAGHSMEFAIFRFKSNWTLEGIHNLKKIR